MLVNGRVFKKDDCLFRVILLDPPEYVYTIGLDGFDREVPHCLDYKTFKKEYDQGIYELVSDPYRGKALHKKVTEDQKRRADRYYQAIGRYWNNPVRKKDLLDSGKRALIVEELAKELGISDYSVKRQLTRFFRRGMSRNALIPDFDKRGGLQNKGKIKNRSGEGLPLDDKMRENFRKGYYKYYHGTGNTLKEAHDYLVRDFYPEAIEKGDDSLAPTFNQFYTWINNNISKIEKDQDRINPTDFDNNHKILSAYSTSQVESVGGIFEMDDTQLDIYLVSSTNRDIVVGKPHLFSIIDVYSSLVCGFCLSLQNESWDTASRALNNCVEDKVDYCARYGIEIESWEWPCHYLPSALMNDNGKVKSHNIEPIAFEYGMDPEFAKPYGASMKSKVERSHRKFNDWIKRKLPGASQKDEGSRGAVDYAKDACLTLEELTKIIILLALDFNKTPISKYPLSPELLTRDITPSPAELWELSIECTGGDLIAVDDLTKFRTLTLPHEKRQIHRDGIHFKNLVYSSNDSRIITLLYNNLHEEVSVFYDILDIRKVYIEINKHLYPLTLKNKEAFKTRLSIAELNYYIARKGSLSKHKNLDLIGSRIKTQEAIDKIVDQAVKSSHVQSPKVNIQERNREIIRDKVERMPEQPKIRERRPSKKLDSRFDEARRRVLQNMEAE